MDKPSSMTLSKQSYSDNGNFRYKQAFLFPWNIGRNALSIVQHGDKFELRINNQSFTHLWENGK